MRILWLFNEVFEILEVLGVIFMKLVRFHLTSFCFNSVKFDHVSGKEMEEQSEDSYEKEKKYGKLARIIMKLIYSQ